MTRYLVDGCGHCGYSLVFCRCVTHIDGPDARCCNSCDHTPAAP